jgi:hypothetical protein
MFKNNLAVKVPQGTTRATGATTSPRALNEHNPFFDSILTSALVQWKVKRGLIAGTTFKS